MLDARRRLVGRLSCWAFAAMLASGLGLAAFGQSGPATTTVADTVYQANGTPASGSLLISWPAFVTAGGTAVAPGTTSTTLGANGALSVALVPNAGATPAGVYYSVVYQLGPGGVRTEYWVVPTASPANLAAVQTTPGSGVAAQPVSMQYVNSQLAVKANDSAVVHLSGSETIVGAKTFSISPGVPAPSNATDVATKGYVDQSVANVGAGNYLSTAGGTMSGPITLPGNPSAPLQAAPKQYVDFGMAGKADLIAGVVPASELGSGTASAGSCLVGNGTSSGSWGACGGGGGTGNVSTAPVASQIVTQPEGTQFSANNLANVRYVTASWNWTQSPTDSLATAGSNTIHLNPCPLGIDTSANANRPYYVYIAGTGVAEAALVTGGTCASGMAGTIVATTVNSHAAGYTVGSSTSGIQEALNDAGPVGAGVVIPPTGANGDALPVYSTIYMQNSRSSLRGEGKPALLCKTRSVCVFLGDRVNSDDFSGIEVSGIRFAAGSNFDGIPITNTACAANVSTITLNNTGANAVQAGDWVDINWTFNPHYFGIHLVASASATQFTYADTNCGGGSGTIASQASAGFASLENAAIEDNGNGSSLRDLYMTDKGVYAAWGGLWQNHIVVDNDQAFKLDTLNVDVGPNCTTNYCGQSIYFPGPFSVNASVAWLSHLNLSLNCGGNGVTDFAGNTIRIQNSVIQAFRQWGVYDGTPRGGYGGGQFDDLYEEVGNCTNPLYPGTGVQKQGMAGLLNSGNTNSIHGGEFPIGQLPQFAATGNQATQYNYCFVVHDTSYGVSKCLKAGFATVDGTSPSGNIVVSWPRVQGTGTVTYDLVRSVGSGNLMVGPYTGNCGGGSTTACGSVATGLAQCGTTLCSYTDAANASTSSYAMAAPNYVPGIFWLPGGLVSVTAADSSHMGTVPTYMDDDSVMTSISPMSTEGGLMSPQVFTLRCSSGNANEWVSCPAGNSNGNNAPPDALVLQYGMAQGGMPANLKGRLNFTGSQAASVNSGEIVTLVDSNPAKTLATSGNRPTEDAGDTFLGLDSGGVSYGGAGLAVGAPVSISSYINSTPNGTSYLERLTAAAKTFNVPVTVNGSLAVTSGTVTLPITGTGMQCLHVSSTGAVTGTGSDCGSGGSGTTGTVNNGNAAQVAMYSANGTAVSGDTNLTDNGTTLSYGGAGGISAASASITGNLTVSGALSMNAPVSAANGGFGVSTGSSTGLPVDVAGLWSFGCLNTPTIDIRCFFTHPWPTAAQAQSQDFGAVLSAAFTAAGASGACVDLDGLDPVGTVYATTNPFAGMGTNSAPCIIGGNFTVVTGATWETPAGPFRMEAGVPYSQSGGMVIQPCNTVGGCNNGTGGITVPQFPSAASCTTAGGLNCWATGLPGKTLNTYSAGTITVTNGNPGVTGAGTTFTSAMVGGFIISDCSANTCTGNPATWISARIKTFNSATSVTLEGSWSGASNSGQNYIIWLPNTPLVVCDGCLSTSAQKGETGHVWKNIAIDMNGLPGSVGYYTKAVQEGTYYENMYIAAQVSNPTGAGAVSAAFAWDNSLREHSGAAPTFTGHSTFMAPRVALGTNAGGSNTYGMVILGYSIIDGSVLASNADGPALFQLGAVIGASGAARFQDCWYFDGIFAGKFVGGHCEYVLNDGVEVGAVNPTYNLSIENMTSSNSMGNAEVEFHGGTSGSCAKNISRVAGGILIEDDNLAVPVLATSSPTTPASSSSAPYCQPANNGVGLATSGALTAAAYNLCANTTSSGTAQSCNTLPGFTPIAGSCVTYTTTTANSGTGLTVNVNGVGAQPVAVWLAGTGWTTSLTSSPASIPSGKPMTMCDDGTNWDVQGSGMQAGGVNGPWYIDSPIPSTAMSAASTGTSAIGVSSDGNFYVSVSGSVPAMVATTASPTFTGTATFTGAISGASANFSGNVTVGGQIIGTGPWEASGPVPGVTITPEAGTSQVGFDTNGVLTVSENGGLATQVAKVNSNISGMAANLSGTQTANYVYAAPNGGSGAAGFRALVAADIPPLNQNTTGSSTSLSVASALPNGTTATTQTAGDSSTKLATDGFVAASYAPLASAALTGVPTAPTAAAGTSTTQVATTGYVASNFAALSAVSSAGDYPKISANNPTPTIADSGVLAGPYAIPWITAVRGGAGAAFSANVVKMWGVVLTFPVKTTNLTYDVMGADNTANNYDVGIANTSGTIVLNIGATPGTTFAPAASAAHTIAWTQGTTVLQPGKYYIVLTTNCASSCATIAADSSVLAVTFQNATTAGTTSGGALSSFTPPTDAWSWGASLPALVVR